MRDHPRADLESEVAVDLAADRPHDGHFSRIASTSSSSYVTFLPARWPPACMLVCPGHEHDDVVAHVQEGMQHASAQALPVSQQQHDRDQAPADAQHGQRRARAVAHQRLPALRDEFFEKHGFITVDQLRGHGSHGFRGLTLKRTIIDRLAIRVNPCKSVISAELLDVNVARSRAHAQQRAAAVHFPVNRLVRLFHAALTVISIGSPTSTVPELVEISASNAAFAGSRTCTLPEPVWIVPRRSGSFGRDVAAAGLAAEAATALPRAVMFARAGVQINVARSGLFESRRRRCRCRLAPRPQICARPHVARSGLQREPSPVMSVSFERRPSRSARRRCPACLRSSDRQNRCGCGLSSPAGR